MAKKLKMPAARISKMSSDPMDLALLEQMVKLMSEHDLSTVDVRNGDKRVVLKRGPQYVTSTGPALSHTPALSHAAPTPAGPVHAGPTTPAAPAADANAGLTAIKSPMVGTFYSSASPDAKPFVSVGSSVDEETDVCVIEAMKVFNSIKAETRGTIAKIEVKNGQSVEFGQVLFYVKA